MLRNKVKTYITHELQYGDQRKLYHYNCAEAILNGANDYYNLNLDKRALNMIIPFGGGMQTENTCGMLTGGIAVIGVLFAEDMPTKNLKLKETTRYWIKQFKSEFQDTNCSVIKGVNLTDNEGCAHLILKAADVLESVIEKYSGEIKD